MEIIVKSVISDPEKGDLLKYDVICDDGEFHEDGLISLDLQWIYPVSLSARYRVWHKIIFDDRGTLTMVSEVNGQFVPLANELISAVQTTIFEREVLKPESKITQEKTEYVKE